MAKTREEKAAYAKKKYQRSKEDIHKTKQLIWESVRILKTFTVQDIKAVVEDVDVKLVERYIRILERALYLQKQGDYYKVIVTMGSKAIYSKRAGGGIYDPNTDKEIPYYYRGCIQEEVWFYARANKVFIFEQLMESLQSKNYLIKAGIVDSYLTHLIKVGYVDKVNKIYELKVDTGYWAPLRYRKKKGIYDMNLRKIIPFKKELERTIKVKKNIKIYRDFLKYIRKGKEFHCLDIFAITDDFKLSKGWCRALKDKGIIKTIRLERFKNNRMYAVYQYINDDLKGEAK
ncbi:hypothetical protein ABSA28_01130 [Candidatus Hepatincolaceae symbiont of Richtersius coronifer]